MNYKHIRMIKKPIVAGIGELLWDVLPSGKQLGGAPCNFAFHAQQAGCESVVISAVGQDVLGKELVDTMTQLGLTTDYVQVNAFPTSTVTIKLDEAGHPDYTIHEQVAWDHILLTEQMLDVSGKLDAVCFGSLAQREEVSANTIALLILSLNQNC